MGYIYQADVYCNDCGAAICASLKSQGKAPEDEMDHRSYNSDDYPKDADVEHNESDVPEHCAQCGKFMHNPLTSDGYRYVADALSQLPALTSIVKLQEGGHSALAEWASWYGFDYWTADDCGPIEKHQVPGWYSDESY